MKELKKLAVLLSVYFMAGVAISAGIWMFDWATPDPPRAELKVIHEYQGVPSVTLISKEEPCPVII